MSERDKEGEWEEVVKLFEVVVAKKKKGKVSLDFLHCTVPDRLPPPR